MIYYGIVDKIKAEHKNGVYGRRQLTNDEKISLKKREALLKDSSMILATSIILLGRNSPFNYMEYKSPITRQYGNDDSTLAGLIFQNNLLNNDYNIAENEDLFYGLFDNFYQKNDAFKKIMKSKGGSTLIIIERDSIPKNMHYGGEFGHFNCGLYCSHPKNEKLLIPLENSNELIKTLILEETLSAYEALGAKKILIEDKTTNTASVKAETINGSANLDYKFEKEILREKLFGKGTFDEKRALQDSLFIHDFPNITTTIRGRINGNQTSEKFTENINLSVGLDLEVLKLFKGNVNFEYSRRWYFEIEFYDKNESPNV